MKFLPTLTLAAITLSIPTFALPSANADADPEAFHPAITFAGPAEELSERGTAVACTFQAFSGTSCKGATVASSTKVPSTGQCVNNKSPQGAGSFALGSGCRNPSVVYPYNVNNCPDGSQQSRYSVKPGGCYNVGFEGQWASSFIGLS